MHCNYDHHHHHHHITIFNVYLHQTEFVELNFLQLDALPAANLCLFPNMVIFNMIRHIFNENWKWTLLTCCTYLVTMKSRQRDKHTHDGFYSASAYQILSRILLSQGPFPKSTRLESKPLAGQQCLCVTWRVNNEAIFIFCYLYNSCIHFTVILVLLPCLGSSSLPREWKFYFMRFFIWESNPYKHLQKIQIFLESEDHK